MYSYIYVASNSESEITYSGIKFHEFYKYVEPKIENMALLKGDYLGKKCVNNFELLEGREQIDEFAEEMRKIPNILGDFNFLDYHNAEAIARLSDEEIKDILFLSHMWHPSANLFFEVLQNRFVYLSHDDDWYCKLYCRNPCEFVQIMLGKIASWAKLPIPSCSSVIIGQLLQLIASGVFIDLEEMNCDKKGADVRIYTIGEYSNIDDVFCNLKNTMNNAIQINNLLCNEEGWEILQV